jgi:hypothetical protein
VIGTRKWTKPGSLPQEELQLKAAGDGWHTLRLVSANLPANGIPFELTATYTATQEINL